MRDPLERVSVRVKLSAMFVSICLLAFGVGGWAVSTSARECLEKEIGERLKMHSRAVASALESEVQTLYRRTEDFASDGHIRKLLAERLQRASANSMAELDAELLRHLRENKLPLVEAFNDLSLVDDTGQLVVHTGARVDSVCAAVALESASKDRIWQSALVERTREPAYPEFAIATPVLSIDGKTELGRLLSWVHPGIWVTNAVSSGGFQDDLKEGLIEIRLQDHVGRVLELQNSLLSANISGGVSDLVRSGFGLRIANQIMTSTRTSRHPIAASGWAAAVHRVDDRALNVIAGLQSRFLAVGGALTLLAALLLFFPLRFLARPLSRLHDAATRLREGDYKVRVNVESQDEIGSLATAFNHMAVAIEERTQSLEAVALDLRAQKASLRHESARLHAVISSMHDGLLVTDDAGTPVVQNAAARPLLSILGSTNQSIRSHHPCRDESAAAECGICLFDAAAPPRACRVDIEGAVYEVRSTPLATYGSERAGRVLVARDITDRVAGEERQVHQERLAVLGEVASVMAHELNNPLAAISMFAQMTEAELSLDSPHREALSVIRRNTETCKRTIRELLDYATDTSPESLPVDVHAVLADAVRFLRPVRERAGIHVDLDTLAAEAVVVGDEVQLRQVFTNLLVNAFQSMSGSGGQVRVITRNSGGVLEVDVEDQGGGVPSNHRESIFKPFFTTKARGEGTGLGLSTARRIAELHGGGLELAKTSPQGSTFRVKLRVLLGARNV